MNIKVMGWYHILRTDPVQTSVLLVDQGPSAVLKLALTAICSQLSELVDLRSETWLEILRQKYMIDGYLAVLAKFLLPS